MATSGRVSTPKSRRRPSGASSRHGLHHRDHQALGSLRHPQPILFLIGGSSVDHADDDSPGPTTPAARALNELVHMHGTTMIFLAVMPLS